MNKKVSFRDLGLIDYKQCWDFQEKLFSEVLSIKSSNRKKNENVRTKNYLIFCEHPHVYTLGRSGNKTNLLVNKDNYALGTLCMTNPKPISLSEEKILSVQKITENIALLLDVQAEQKEVTSQKILEALVVFQSKKTDFSINDFKKFLMLSADLKIDGTNSEKLIETGLCDLTNKNFLKLTKMGRHLQVNMKLESKPMRKIKLSGDAAENLIDEMFASLN